MAEKEVN